MQLTHPEVAQPKREPYSLKFAIAPFLEPRSGPKSRKGSGVL